MKAEEGDFSGDARPKIWPQEKIATGHPVRESSPDEFEADHPDAASVNLRCTKNTLGLHWGNPLALPDTDTLPKLIPIEERVVYQRYLGAQRMMEVKSKTEYFNKMNVSLSLSQSLGQA